MYITIYSVSSNCLQNMKYNKYININHFIVLNTY